jgi:hypothetical protein
MLCEPVSMRLPEHRNKMHLKMTLKSILLIDKNGSKIYCQYGYKNRLKNLLAQNLPRQILL